MTQVWKTVRVFISSTFRDMHAERDHLVRFVFPELRERCAKRQLHLVDVDLRWGVTEEEAEQKILEVCLDEIERCRPFFIGILGERYGWVPPKYEVPDERHYDWVREFEPGHSITALEIYHGVLRNPDMKMHAFFYFRDPAFLSEVPREHRKVFLPESEESIEIEKLKRLKNDILSQHCPVFDYSCAFGGIGEDGKVMLTGLEAFGQRVLEDLWSAIEMEYPVVGMPPDELAIERAYHEAFIEGRCQRFIGRRDLLEQVTAYAEGENNVPLVITGAPGCGKSALLANFARAYATAHSDVFVLPHFIGVSPGSTDIRRTLLRLCRELAHRFGIADEIPEDYEKLRGVFTKFIEQAASQGKVLLILDALNQLDESYYAHTLNWLPYTLPKNLRLMVSTLEGDCFEALHRRRPTPSEITMGPLAPEDRRQIIRQILWDYRKRLDERPEKDQMGLLLKKGESDNPLYLIVVCEELRVFGEFEKVTERITSLPDDVPMLFEQVLERLEYDHGKELVKSALSLLACARHGLLETEMLELLRHEGEEQLPRVVWARLYRSLQFYLRPPGEMGEGALNFFHRQLAKAVRQRYLEHEEEERAGHRRLAEYFRRKADPDSKNLWQQNPRLLGELPFHLAHGARETELRELFSQLAFLSARVATSEVYEQVADYSLVGSPLPSALAHWHDFLQKHAQRLTQHPEMLVALVNHEGFSEARAQVANVPWQQPWLRTSPEQMPAVETMSTEGLHAEVTGNLQFHWSRVSAIATQRAVAFYLEHLGIIRVFDTNSMQQTDAILSIRRDRPLVLACAPDATSVSVFYDSGKAELYHCIFGQNELPSRLELVVEFCFHLPESENPVVVWHKGAFWYQAKAGTIGCISVESPHPLEETLSAGQQGELSALVFVEGKRLVMLRQGFDTLLLVPGAPSLRRQFAHVATACACGGRKVAAAFTDGAIVVFEVADTLTAKAEVRAGMLRGALGWDGSRLLWVGESSGFSAWRPEEASQQPVQDNQEIFPSHLHVLPCQWFSRPDGSILLGTTHSVVTFNVLQGGAVTEGRLEDIFGGPVWRAVRKRGKDQWLLEKQPLREVLLGREVMGRLYCAPDGRGLFFAASGYGPGLVFDLATLRSAPLQGCPLGINIAVGENDGGGCWFTDRTGDIYFADATAQCRCAAKFGLPDIYSSLIVNCGNYLVWAGYSSEYFRKYFPETGDDQARTFVFFSKVQKNLPVLERLGEQFWHPREGRCVAICYDQAAKRLVTLWAKAAEGEPYKLRIGSVKEFAHRQFEEIDVCGLGPVRFVQANLSANGRLLGVVNMAGEISCLSVADGRVLATLAGSAPFTSVAPGADGSEFWLVEARTRVYKCALVEGTT